ncbi:hypothetical protein [Paenibacillus sp. S28]|uniref:hypothetical protein n=1 Tax=Paenibacillus sp. S28 TaxID=2767463 RepID=UPI001909B4AD|nr:hypothetical protein [Paenibacillus sp. S28]MBJ9992396.1 hypothetical protein [Paenibacillus sp. S28]
MKIKIKLMFLLPAFLMNLGGICAAAPEEQVENSAKDIRTYTLSVLHSEINDAISREFHITDWGFIPKKVCEINGTSLTLEGDLFKDNKVQKKIRVDLEKNDNSGYMVTRVSEIPESTNTD